MKLNIIWVSNLWVLCSTQKRVIISAGDSGIHNEYCVHSLRRRKQIEDKNELTLATENVSVYYRSEWFCESFSFFSPLLCHLHRCFSWRDATHSVRSPCARVSWYECICIHVQSTHFFLAMLVFMFYWMFASSLSYRTIHVILKSTLEWALEREIMWREKKTHNNSNNQRHEDRVSQNAYIRWEWIRVCR